MIVCDLCNWKGSDGERTYAGERKPTLAIERGETMDAIRKAILRAIIYARVSTDDQADRGYSLPTQLEACRKYAERLGFTVVAEFMEDCSGAILIAERPEGKKAVGMLKRREVDAIIVHQVDRLSRDIVDLLASVRIWLRAGIQVHAGDIGRIESELDIVLVIKGWQGSDERRRIIERTRRGAYGKAKSGKVVGTGKPPYGYRYVQGCFEIVEVEAGVVLVIYNWYVRGDEDGNLLNEYAIARRLSEMRIPSPGENRGCRRVRKSAMWDTSAVHRILTNETYAGTWHYGKTIGDHGKGGKRSKDEQIAVTVSPIIDRELWKVAQTRREHNKHMSKRNAKHDYLLRGMVKCGCGFAMVGSCDPRYDRRFYRCSRQLNRFAGVEEIGCKEKRSESDPLEQYAWDYIKKVMTSSQDFEGALREAQRAEEQSLEPKREQLTTLVAQIAETEKEAAEIAQALKKASRGGVVEKNLMADMERIEKLYAAQVNRRDELQAGLDIKRYSDENIAAALQFRENVIWGLQDPTPENIRHAFEILNTSVTVKDGKARVRCIIPAQPGVFDLRIPSNPPSRPSKAARIASSCAIT